MLNEFIQNGSIGDNADESIIKYAAKRIPHASVAKAAGIATSTLDAALANRSIQVEKAIAIANALGHSVEDLFLMGEKEYFLSPKTVREHLNVVSSVLEYATREQLIAQNPANFVDKPEAELGEREHYSKEEVREIITTLESLDESQIHWVTMTFVLVFSGIRRGEDLGLSIDDVDFDQNTISIHGDLVYVSGLGLILKKRPKSDDSVRVLHCRISPCKRSASTLRGASVRKNKQGVALIIPIGPTKTSFLSIPQLGPRIIRIR